LLVGDGRLARPAERSEALERIMAGNSKLTGLGIALGAALGAVAGVMAGHIAIWLGIGIAIGMALGASFRSKNNECPECAVVHQEHEVRSRRLES
jgi:predicted MFS family arabinose efflux permease